MKILFISNMTNKITNFAMPSIYASKKLDIEFHHAANWRNLSEEIRREEEKYGIKIHNIEFERNPFNLKNYKAYKQLLRLMKEHKFDIVHCNTPIGGILGRICSKQMNIKKVIYTVHVFHFYKGAPKLNNIIYKNVEKYLAKLTTSIITITKEDYESALEFKKVNRELSVFYVPGVGINTNEIIGTKPNRNKLCQELGVNNESFLIISAGELNKNKNQKIIIEAISDIEKNKDIHYIICGIGPMENELRKLAFEKGIDKNIHFLGYRKDIVELMKSSDVFVMPSYREGLSRSMMEAMAAGLPCIASKIRGNVDLIENGQGGYLCDSNDVDSFSKAIKILSDDVKLRKSMSKYNLDRIKDYDVENIITEIDKIYNEELA